ncbi:Calcium/calmodulin-dependent protein kinase type IV [Balamuthia mandrillaris]
MQATSLYRSEPLDEHYTIHDVLGRGNYSVVKLGVNKESGKRVAVKMIDKKDAGAKALKMIETEVQILSTLSHPNIVKLQAVYETETHYHLVMDLISGGELFDRIVQLQHYSEKHASTLIRQLVSAIKHMHDQHVVHRDLKPENLLLENENDDSPVLVADFGLSKFITPEEPLTVPVGTPGYVAPEVVKCLDEESEYGLEIDMWAVGVILYILLCGYPPFYSEDDDEVFDQILEGEYDYPSPHWDKISESAKDLINHLLVLDPKKRFTAADCLEHPWVKGAECPDANLDDTITELKKFNAKRKWKGAILATMAMNRLSSKFVKLRVNSSRKELPPRKEKHQS